MSTNDEEHAATPELEMLDPPPSESASREEALAPDSIIVPEWVPKKVQRRLLRLSSYVHATTGAYALSAVPPHANWGTNPFFTRYLCVDHTPVTLYTLGSLSELHFHIASAHRPRFSISVEFLRNGDEEALSKLLRRARPRQANMPAIFTATPTLEDERASFCAIYDATAGLRAKSEMEHVNLASLTPGDVVLLESSFVRKMLTGCTWTVAFDLEAIMVMSKAPRNVAHTINL